MKPTIRMLGITGGVVGLLYSLFIAFFSMFGGQAPSPANGYEMSSSAGSLLLLGILGAAGSILAIIGGIKLTGARAGLLMLFGGFACVFAFTRASINLAFTIIGICIFVLLALGGVLSFINKDKNEQPVSNSKKVRDVKIYGSISVVIYSDEVNIEKNDSLVLVRNLLYSRALGSELFAADIEKNMFIISADTGEIKLKTKDINILTGEQRIIFESLSDFNDYTYVYEI